MQSAISIQIIAEPLELKINELNQFNIGVEATNNSDKPIDPKMYDIVLEVDGERNYAWDLAIQNSPREEAWWNLEPGETITALWPLGEAMFAQPGQYEIVIRLEHQESLAHVLIKQENDQPHDVNTTGSVIV